jgi:hypothetical protein
VLYSRIFLVAFILFFLSAILNKIIQYFWGTEKEDARETDKYEAETEKIDDVSQQLSRYVHEQEHMPLLRRRSMFDRLEFE